MKTGHDIDHDHTAIRAMLAEQAASDTEWDVPPVLFALVYDPAGGYGVVPVRPFNTYILKHMRQHPFRSIMAGIVDVAKAGERKLPGLDPLRVAVEVCRSTPGMAQEWFPQVSEHTLACGMVLRNESFMTPVREGMPAPEGPIADDPAAIEALTWHAVTDDDTYNLVIWKRGDAAPQFDTWSFNADRYSDDTQHVPALMRKIVQVNARASLIPWPPPPETDPGIFARP